MQIKLDLTGYSVTQQQLINLGYEAYRNNDFMVAVAYGQKVLSTDGKVAPAYYLVADALAGLGKHDNAAIVLLNGLARLPNDIVLKTKYVWQLDHIEGLKYHKDVLHYLVPCLDEPGINQKAGVIAGGLLEKKYCSISLATLSFNEVLAFLTAESAQQHLNQYLMKTINYKLPLESLLIGLRKALLTHIDNVQADDLGVRDFIFALAVQCFSNEYVFDVTKEESLLLSQLIDKAKENPNWLSIGLIACYLPLVDFPDMVSTVSDIKEDSRLVFSTFFKRCWTDVKQEKAIASRIESLGSALNNEVSVKVSQQYETYPYPRWLHPTCSGTPYRQRILKMTGCDSATLGEFATESTLIAGCGTGSQPVSIAIDNPTMAISAFDLSKSSLAYGIRKAGELGVNNINWFQCDILNLDCLEKQYDIVECAGVLHHMQSPDTGLKSILKTLKPGGILYLALYSQVARRQVKVNRSRELISNNLDSNKAGIVEFRRRVIAQESEFAELHTLTQFADFYSASALKDFVFHAHELQYNLTDIRDLCTKHKLSLIGFNLGENAQARMAKWDKTSANEFQANDWNYWIRMEEQHPELFVEMYQFWLVYNP